MTFRSLVIIACATFALVPAAQAQPVSCDKAQTQLDLNICGAQAFEEADKRLNTAYKALMKDLDGEVKQLTRDGQRAWITFRDKECLAQAGGERTQASGSMWPMLHSMCLADLTRQRAQQIEERMGDCVGGGKSC